MDLDHVAIAQRDVTEALTTLVRDLGAVVLGGGHDVGFRIVQVQLGEPPEGMKVELIEPWLVERFDFLDRFLRRHGDGPHHLTFKVQGIRDVLARLEEAGYRPVSTNLENPWWREAFFHPRQAFGTVIQVAESSVDSTSDVAPSEDDWERRRWWPDPPPRGPRRAALRRVVLGVPDLERALAFFEGLLGGHRVGEGAGAVDLTWPGGGGLRLTERPGGAGGIEALECEWDGPSEERVIGGTRFHLT